MKITDVSIDNRTSVMILVFILIIVGSISYVTLPREAAPDIQVPLVIVSTPYFGVSPEDIESLITQPIEKELNAISEVTKITSSSFEGYSLIQAEFESGYEIDDALQKVRDKVEKAEADLPEDVEKPEIIEINFSEFPIMTFNISGPQGLVQLKDIAEDMKEDIENIEGVLEVNISGGLEREVKIDVDIDKLVHYNVRFDDVINAVRDENQTIPGGSIDLANKSFLVRIPGEFSEPFLIDDLIVKMDDGYPIYVRDIADVSYSFKDKNTYSRLNGIDGVTIDVSKRIGANIINVADQIKALIKEYEERLPESLKFTLIVDQSKEIKQSVKNLENNIFSGLVLVLVVLFSLLGWRNAVFVAMAIPLSMLMSFVILSFMGITLNFVVLFSLILALGMLVDNAIVVIENIYKFLEEGYSLMEAAKQGAKEVAWPITTSTATTLTAFFPLLFWPGIMGDFLGYLPLTLIITLSSSLFIALVINPVFASIFMKIPVAKEGKKPGFIKRITNKLNNVLLPKTIDFYEKLLRKSLGETRDPKKKVTFNSIILTFLVFVFIITIFAMIGNPAVPNVIVLIASVLIGGLLIYAVKNPRLKVVNSTVLALVIIILTYFEFDHGVELFPDVDPPIIFINVESPAGANIDMSNKIASNIEKQLEPFFNVDVREVIVNVGKSNNPFDGGSSTPNKSTITVQFEDYDKRKQSSSLTTDQIREAVKNIAGAEIEVKKQDAGPPVGYPVNVEIIGEDFYKLGELSQQVKEKIKDIPGLVDLNDNYDSGRPEVRIEVNREKAALFNMNTSLIANAVRTAINGFEASQYRINEEEYDITVRLKEDQRNNIDKLRNLKINYNDKQGKTLSVPLITVADIEYSTGPGAIRRKDLNRVVTVTGNVDAGFNKNKVLQDVIAKLGDFKLPPNYKLDYTGENEEQAKAAAFLMKAFGIAFLGITLILVIQFNSAIQPMIIMLAVLISLIGVFLGLTVFAMSFGIIMTGIGVISLAGVVVNNNIVLMDYINILRGRGTSINDAVVGAGVRRFRPVTLTAITTVLGLIPLTFGFGFDIYSLSFESGGADADFWRQMGVAVIFGLMFGTLLTLVIVPVLFSLINDIGFIMTDRVKRIPDIGVKVKSRLKRIFK